VDPPKTSILKLLYHSLDQFRGDYKQFHAGRVVLASARVLSPGSRIKVIVTVAGCPAAAALEAEVLYAAEPAPAAGASGSMAVGLLGDFHAALLPLEEELDRRSGFGRPPGQPAGSPAKDPPLTMTWIMAAVDQKETALEPETPYRPAPPPAERRELTAEERERVQPAAAFVMDLVKAMLRTGYYSPEHPGSRQAKLGLYNSLQGCLADAHEIMILNRETRESRDILISGILEEPVNVRLLVGPGMADLFVPKLREYCHRKGLVSFAVKKEIGPEHFERFVDIMSDPRADRSRTNAVGELLTRALAREGITAISTVFLDDIIILERNLPWRVEMAIQRLAKDLKVLPLFRAESDDAIKQMKLQIIQDILRPLRQPEFLKDLIVNCYVIAKHVEGIEEEAIEGAVIEAFPLEALLPTSRYIFDEMHRLRELSARDPGNDAVKRRFGGVRRILKRVTRRLVVEQIAGAQSFLEQLHQNGILAFHELPPDVQAILNTQKMARDVRAHLRGYIERLLACPAPAEAEALLKCFRRVIPPFMERKEWRVIRLLTRAVKTASAARIITPEMAGLPANPLLFLFADRLPELQAAYAAAAAADRPLVEDVFRELGSWGIEILCRTITAESAGEVRRAAIEALCGMGAAAAEWLRGALDAPGAKWSLKRSALILLGRIAAGRPEEDAEAAGDLDRVRGHLSHYHPRVREEALNTLLALRAADAERRVLAALDDPDDKVRWRAADCLAELAPLSRAGLDKVLAILRRDIPEEKEDAARHRRRVLQLLRTVAEMHHFEDPEAVEGAVLELAQKAAARKAGLLTRMRTYRGLEESDLFSVAVTTLGVIGGGRAERFVAAHARGKSREAEAAGKALKCLRDRRRGPASG
jgi:hypothetical protein